MAPKNTRMQAAIDALTPMGFSPITIRNQVRYLLNEVYGAQGWPFIEAEAYRVLIDHILELQESAPAVLPPPPPPPQTPNIPSQDPQIPENPTENPIPLQLQASSPTDAYLIPSPQIENIQQTPNPSLGENHLQNQLHIEAQIAAALATCNSAPPGFERERKDMSRKPKRRPYLGWIGPKDDNDFVILEPMPYKGKEESRGARGKRKSRWDEKP